MGWRLRTRQIDPITAAVARVLQGDPVTAAALEITMGRYAELRFLRADEVRKRPGEVTFRERRLPHVLATAITAAISAALLFNSVLAQRLGAEPLPAAVGFVGGVGSALLALLFFAGFRASLRRSNWLLRAAADGLYVKYRSFRNYKFPAEDPIVVLIPRPEVAWIRARRQDSVRPTRKHEGAQTVRRRFLEIKLYGGDLSELDERLRDERRRTAPGVMGSKTKVLHYPVRVLPDAIVQIDWRSPATGISPRIDRAIRILGRWYRVADAVDERQVSPGKLDRAQQEARLIEMTERGEVMDAVVLAKEIYGFDTTQAKTFVDDLREKPAGPASDPTP